MLRECKIKVKGAMSIAAKVEALMKFMEYSAEKIAEVLATLNQRKKVQTDDTIEEGLLQKKYCEAHLITKLLEEKEIEYEEEKAQKAKQSKQKTNPVTSKKSEGEEEVKPPASAVEKVPWPVHEGSGGDGESPEIPLGCRLRQYTPALQSPYWRGELPPGESHHGKCTRSRSYMHSAGIGSAKHSSEQAAVIAWLWEWRDASKEHSATASATSGAASSSGASKKQKTG